MKILCPSCGGKSLELLEEYDNENHCKCLDCGIFVAVTADGKSREISADEYARTAMDDLREFCKTIKVERKEEIG